MMCNDDGSSRSGRCEFVRLLIEQIEESQCDARMTHSTIGYVENARVLTGVLE